jgi:hypothetical protein
MRLSVGTLRQVVKRDLPIEFVPQQLTSYGLELLRRYVRRLALLHVGARQLEHLRYLPSDPLVRRSAGWPACRPRGRSAVGFGVSPRKTCAPSSSSTSRSCSMLWPSC